MKMNGRHFTQIKYIEVFIVLAQLLYFADQDLADGLL